MRAVLALLMLLTLGGCAWKRTDSFELGQPEAIRAEAPELPAPGAAFHQPALSIGDYEVMRMRRAELFREIEHLRTVQRRLVRFDDRALIAAELNRRLYEISQLNMMLGQ